MIPMEIQPLCVLSTLTVREALLRMDQIARGILLVVHPDGKLARTLTDGDLRRAILNQLTNDTPLSALPAQSPITVSEEADAAAELRLMDFHQIDHIPVVNTIGQPIDLVTRRELSQRIWLSSPHLGLEEATFVDEAFKTNWIAPLGPHVDSFERELSEHVGIQHGAALNSGTAAIHLGLICLGVKPGDTVFCSSLTFIGSCNPILYCGAQPVFIDAEPQTWNMSPAALERAFEWAEQVGRLPRCVIIVNLYGQSADMDALLPICDRYDVPVLEDAAESLGATYKHRCSGTFGRIGVFSFNGNKIITTSGGGMLVSNDGDIVARVRKLSTQAREPVPHYEHTEIGFNYRMSNVLAGIGRGQLKVLSQRVTQRRSVFTRYQTDLSDLTQLRWMPEPSGFQSTRWLSCFTLDLNDAALQCKRIMKFLERHLIEARPVWKPMHLQTLFASAAYFSHRPEEDVSARLFETGICLPSGSNLTYEQQSRVIEHLRLAIKTIGSSGIAN